MMDLRTIAEQALGGPVVLGPVERVKLPECQTCKLPVTKCQCRYRNAERDARDAGWTVYQLVKIGKEQYEVISMPFCQDGMLLCYVRQPEMPETMTLVAPIA